MIEVLNILKLMLEPTFIKMLLQSAFIQSGIMFIFYFIVQIIVKPVNSYFYFQKQLKILIKENTDISTEIGRLKGIHEAQLRLIDNNHIKE